MYDDQHVFGHIDILGYQYLILVCPEKSLPLYVQRTHAVFLREVMSLVTSKDVIQALAIGVQHLGHTDDVGPHALPVWRLVRLDSSQGLRGLLVDPG